MLTIFHILTTKKIYNLKKKQSKILEILFDKSHTQVSCELYTHFTSISFKMNQHFDEDGKDEKNIHIENENRVSLLFLFFSSDDDDSEEGT